MAVAGRVCKTVLRQRWTAGVAVNRPQQGTAQRDDAAEAADPCTARCSVKLLAHAQLAVHLKQVQHSIRS